MWTGISGVIALVVAVVGSRPVGRLLKTRPVGWYVAANTVVAVVALALIAASFVMAPTDRSISDALYGAALGLGFGGLAGLRYGYKGLFTVSAAQDRS